MDVTVAITALKAVLPTSQFALRGTKEYEDLNSSTYQSGLNGDITPACILQPRTTQDVSTFLVTIAPFVAAGEAAFVIVGTGRQPAPGCSNIQDGITLNLGLLKGIRIEDGYVSVGAGENCGPVFEKLAEKGLACAGARSAKGGFAGLALSGGLSFFSSRDGFVCDDVVNYEVVLASGAIVNANAGENADLWLALRGDGNNFGVVTSFDMRAFKQGHIYGGSIYYAGTSFPAQVEALARELQKPDASPLTHLMVCLGFAGALNPDPLGLNQLYYLDDVDKSPPVLEPFVTMEGQIPGYNTMRRHTFVEAANEQAGEITIPARGISKKGGNSLGLSPDDGAVVSIALLAYWVDPADDDKILGTFREALDKIDKEADPIGSYGPENKQRLQKASTKYDPEGLFQKGVPGGWKLFT